LECDVIRKWWGSRGTSS